MPIAAPLRRKLYNTRTWKAQRARILTRSYGRCECTGACGRLHDGDGRRCGELNGQQGLWQTGVVVLQVAHVDGARSGEHVPDDQLRAFCPRCHLAHDEPQHLASRHTNRRRKLEAAGQLALAFMLA